MELMRVSRYPLSSWPFWLAGGVFAFFALLFLVPVLLRAFAHHGWHFADGLALYGLLMFSGLAVYALGIAWARPVGLRIDQHGLSGYYVASLTWDEIKSVEALGLYRGHGIGLTLKDPQQFVARQSVWGRVRYALRRRPYDIVIPIKHLKANAQHLVQEMQEHLQR